MTALLKFFHISLVTVVGQTGIVFIKDIPLEINTILWK